ncbi:MAG: single-stranded DNA-binding protein [Solirubrobacterales bacterium]
MLNRAILIGRLTQDPELRYTSNGVGVCRFTLAVNRNFTSQSGERAADYIDIVAWRQLAETCASYLAKGRLVAVEGRIQVRSYETQDGQKRKAFEIVADTVKFLEKAQGQGPRENRPAGKREETDSWDSLGREVDHGDVDMINPDDEIPF